MPEPNLKNLAGLLEDVNGRPVKVIDGNGKMVGEGVVIYSGAESERKLSLEGLRIPVGAIIDVHPSTRFETLVVVDPRYCEVYA